MNEEDLRELLLSIAEEDAIISQLYRFFILGKGYSIDILEQVIYYGISIGWFEIVSVNYNDEFTTGIDWGIDNVSQEILFRDIDIAVNQLFHSSGKIPVAFKQFILEK